MIVIDLYTTPACMPCKILKKKLEDIKNKNLTINVFNALEHPEEGILGTPHAKVTKDGEIIYGGHVNSISWFVNFIKEKIQF